MTKGTQDFTLDPRNERILINVNGVLTPRAEAVVSVFDSSFMLGDGVWEGTIADMDCDRTSVWKALRGPMADGRAVWYQ